MIIPQNAEDSQVLSETKKHRKKSSSPAPHRGSILKVLENRWLIKEE